MNQFFGVQISFAPGNTITDLLGIDLTEIYEKDSFSQNSVDILSFDKIFQESDFAQGMTFKGKSSGINHNFTMDVDPGDKHIEKFRGGFHRYMMESKDIISGNCFKLKK